MVYIVWVIWILNWYIKLKVLETEKRTHLVYKVFDYRLAALLDFLYYYYYTTNYDDDLVSHVFGMVAPRYYRLESILFPVNTYHYHGGWNLCHVDIVVVPNENPDDISLMDTLSIMLIQMPQLHTHNRLSKIRKPRKILIVTLKHYYHSCFWLD